MGPDGKTVEEARGGRGSLWRSFAADGRLVTGEVDADICRRPRPRVPLMVTPDGLCNWRPPQYVPSCHRHSPVSSSLAGPTRHSRQSVVEEGGGKSAHR